MVDVPDSLLAERRRLGHDHFDEMWDGELHMVPAPNLRHQENAAWLLSSWTPLARARGMRVVQDTDLFDPEVAAHTSYRQPDITVFLPVHASERGIEGRAELAVEIRSPGDESYQKIPFYERVGVAELLIIETDLSLRRRLRSGDQLVEQPGGADGWVALDALPVALRPDGDTLVMRCGETWSDPARR